MTTSKNRGGHTPNILLCIWQPLSITLFFLFSFKCHACLHSRPLILFTTIFFHIGKHGRRKRAGFALTFKLCLLCSRDAGIIMDVMLMSTSLTQKAELWPFNIQTVAADYFFVCMYFSWSGGYKKVRM